MLKESVAFNTTRFEAEYGFMVDIIDEVDDNNGTSMWSVWLYRKDIGVKMFMFGLDQTQAPTLADALAIVENNLMEYYPLYDKDFSQNDVVDVGYLGKAASMTELEKSRAAELYVHAGLDTADINMDMLHGYLTLYDYASDGNDYLVYETEAELYGVCIESGKFLDAEEIEQLHLW